MKYLYAILLTLSSLCLSNAQEIEKDWVVTLQEKNLGFGSVLPFLRSPKVIADKFGLVYTCGYAGAGGNHDLLLGDEELPAEGDRFRDYYVSQVDSRGQAKWIKRFSGRRFLGYSYFDLPTILPQEDGGIVLVSLVKATLTFGVDTLANLPSTSHLLVAQVDTAGQVTNFRTLDISIRNLYSVEATKNGDILIAGSYENFNTNLGTENISSEISPSYFISRLSKEGEVKWMTDVSPEFAWQVTGSTTVLESDNGEIFMSISPSAYNTVIRGIPSSQRNIALTKIDGASGALLWKKAIADVGYGHVTDMITHTNGDVHLIGRYGGHINAGNGENYAAFNLSDYNFTNGFMLKLTAEGEIFDLSVSPDGFIGQDIIKISEEHYIIAGKIERKGFNEAGFEGVEPGFGLKIYDRRNNLLKALNLVSENYDQDLTIINAHKISSSSIVVTGKYDGEFLGEEVIEPGFNRGLVFIAKLKVNIDDHQNPSASGANPTVNIFPNPVTDILNVNLGSAFFTGKLLRIFDNMGREVLRNDAIGERTQFTLNLNGLSQGVYYMIVGAENEEGELIPFLKL